MDIHKYDDIFKNARLVDALFELDRKICSTYRCKVGFMVEPIELDVLVLLGAVHTVRQAASDIMSQATWAQSFEASTEEMVAFSEGGLPADAMTSASDASGQTASAPSDAARARLLFG